MTTIFKTFAEAEAAGFERVNPSERSVVDTSGSNAYGYSFSRGEENSVMIYASQERNRVDGLGAHRCYWMPKVEVAK